MINKFTQAFKTALLVLVLFTASKSSFASHARGADISYQCLGPGTSVGYKQFNIQASFYRDCSGIPGPTSMTLSVKSTCGDTTITLNLDSVRDVSDVCDTNQSFCHGGTLQGTQRYFFHASGQLRDSCIYRMYFSQSARNTVTNLTTAGSLYEEAYINTAYCDTSVAFTSKPTPIFCLNDHVYYSSGSCLHNGDSLVYTLMLPCDQGGTGFDTCLPINYNTGYGIGPGQSPVNTGIGTIWNFNSQTGQIDFVPTATGNYSIAFRVDQYRNGVWVGNTTRDVQFVVVNCNNSNCTAVQPCLLDSNVHGGTRINCYTVGYCVNNIVNVCFPISSPCHFPITIDNNIACSIPTAALSFTPTNSYGDSGVVCFTWYPDSTDPSSYGSHYVTVSWSARDTSSLTCQYTPHNYFTYYFNSNLGRTKIADHVLNYCTGGGPVSTSVSGGNHFSWSPQTGIVSSNTDSSVVSFAPNTNTTYIVTSDLGTGCTNQDTMVVNHVNTFSATYSPLTDTICLHSSTTLTVTPTPVSEGPFTYAWSPAASVTPSNAANVISAPTVTTTYDVIVRSRAGCIVHVNPTVNIQGVGPIVVINASSKVGICPGDSITITGYASELACELNPNPATACTDPNAVPFISQLPATAGTSSTGLFTNDFSPFYQDERNARVQYLFRAGELQPLLGGPSTISGIEFNVSTVSPNVLDFQGYTVKMGCTNLNQLPTGGFVQNLSTVMNPNTLAATGITVGWNPLTFDNPYDWDGISNVVVEICFNNTTSSYADDEVTYSPSFAGATCHQYSYSTPGCNLTGANFGYSQYALRPDVKFLGCTAPPANFHYNWTPTTGVGNDTIAVTKVRVGQTGIYTLNVSDGLCNGTSSVNLAVDSATIITSHDTVKCGTDTVTIGVQQVFPAVPVCVADYSVNSITTNWIPGTGIQPTLISGSWDDGYTGALAIGFPFTFYCNSYNNFYLSSNGWITFSPATTNSAYPGSPMPNGVLPHNVIAGCWSDLNFIGCGPVNYFTTGTAPNRMAVINFTNGKFYFPSTDSVNFQIVLHETTNQIDVNYTHISPNNARTHTCTAGVENSGGTVATTIPGRNYTTWAVATPESWRFTPLVSANTITAVSWSPTIGLDSPTIARPRAYPTSTTHYRANVTFANGCVAVDSVTVNVQAFPHTLTFRDSICPGDTTMIHFVGNHIRDYAWSPNVNISDTTIANPIVTGTQTMNYRLIAHDSLGCGFDTTITVHMRHLPSFSLGNDTSICAYDSLVLSPTGGPFVSYTWSTGAATPTIKVKNTGIYSLTVSDGHCTDVDTMKLISVQNPHLKADSSQSICGGQCANIYARDTVLYHGFHWNTGFLANNIQVCFPGNYYYSALDSIGCTWHSDTAHINVGTPPVITITKTKGDTICPLDSNVVNAGSLPGIVYTWSPGGVHNTLTITSAGTYYVTASNNGCISTDSVVQYVRVHPPVSIAYLGKLYDTVCTNSCVTLTPNGGPYNTYMWRPGGANTPTLSACTAGAYFVIVSDNLCSYPSDTFNLYNYSNTPFTIAPATSSICPNALDTLTAQAGFTNYQWANGGPAGAVDIVSTGGNYTCTALDLGGCTVTASATVTVNVPPVITFTFLPNDTFCIGGVDTINAGSLANVNYTWNGVAQGANYYTNVSGPIHVDAVDSKNCHTTADTTIVAITPPTFTLPTTTTCNCDTQITLSPGLPGRYSWTPTGPGSNTPTFTVSKTTTDTTITATILSPYGCVSSASTVIKVLCLQMTYGPKDTLASTLAYGTALDVFVNSNYTHPSNYSGGTFTYVWTPGQDLADSTRASTIYTANSNTTYRITVRDNSTGCVDTISFSTTVDVPGFAIPSGFVPRGTNVNNRYFYPVIPPHSGVLVINLKVYDRWGQLVYNNPVSPGWDGTLDGVLQPMDTYIYYMTITYPDRAHPGQTKTDLRSGNISLIR